MEYNDFSTGDVQSYVIGPMREPPGSLLFEVEGNDVGDVFTVIWEGFVEALESIVESLGDFLLSLIGGHADFVAQRTLLWSPEQLAGIGHAPVPFREFLDGDDEGQYHLFGSIRRIEGAGAPYRFRTFEVLLERLECWEESTETSAQDEPFLLALLVNLADHDPARRVQRMRTSPASVDKGDSAPIHHLFRAHVPEGSGGLALPMAVYESDQESAAARDALLSQFAGDTVAETRQLERQADRDAGGDRRLGLEARRAGRLRVHPGSRRRAGRDRVRRGDRAVDRGGQPVRRRVGSRPRDGRTGACRRTCGRPRTKDSC